MARHSITAVFDTRSHAEQAMAELKSSGISPLDVTLVPPEGETATSADTSAVGDRDVWGSLERLFGAEDHAIYAESIRRGGFLLAVRAADDRFKHIVNILERHGSVDLDEREASWRNEGWTGTTTAGSAMTSSHELGLQDPGMTARGDAPASRISTATPAVGTLGAGAALGGSAGTLGSAAYEERREAASPDPSAAERTTLAANQVLGDSAVASTGADEMIKVYEERLDVGKRAVSHGKVKVHTSVVSREVNQDVTLHGETVTVDRRSVDRPVSAAALDVNPFQERTIEIEAYDEEVVVAKSAHVVEEIGIRKNATNRTETVHETLRSTKVDIEDSRNVDLTTTRVRLVSKDVRRQSVQSIPAAQIHNQPVLDFEAEARRLGVKLGHANSREEAVQILQKIAEDADDLFSSPSEALSFLTKTPLDGEGRDGIALMMERGLPSIILRLDDLRFGFQG